MSILIIDTLKQKNSGTFPVVEDIDIKGSLRSVATLSGLYQTSTEQLKSGMLAYVSGVSNTGYYKFTGPTASGWSFIGEFASQQYVTTALSGLTQYLTADTFAATPFNLMPDGGDNSTRVIGAVLNRWSELWVKDLYTVTLSVQSNFEAAAIGATGYTGNIMPNFTPSGPYVPGVDYTNSIGSYGDGEGPGIPFFEIYGYNVYATNILGALTANITNLNPTSVTNNLTPSNTSLQIGYHNGVYPDESGYWQSLAVRYISILDGVREDLLPYKYWESSSILRSNLGSLSYPWLAVYADSYYGDGSNLTNLPMPDFSSNLTISGSWSFLTRPTISGVGFALLSDTPDLSGYVSVDSEQTISGIKTFSNRLVVNNQGDGITLQENFSGPGNNGGLYSLNGDQVLASINFDENLASPTYMYANGRIKYWEMTEQLSITGNGATVPILLLSGTSPSRTMSFILTDENLDAGGYEAMGGSLGTDSMGQLWVKYANSPSTAWGKVLYSVYDGLGDFEIPDYVKFKNRPTYSGINLALVTDTPDLSAYVNTTTNQTVSGIKTFADTQYILGELFVTGPKHFIVEDQQNICDHIVYTALEGNRNDIYFRGEISEDCSHVSINYPREWEFLADSKTITILLSPFGHEVQDLHYAKGHNKFTIVNMKGSKIKCSYHVYAERKDIPKLEVYRHGTKISN